MIASELRPRLGALIFEMETDYRMKLSLWGVRGSTPTPQRENLGYGGNTSCVEVRLPEGEVFIFDGGTGIRSLGESLEAERDGAGATYKIFLTHFHWDHTQGIPFFAPLYDEKNEVVFHAHNSQFGVEEVLKRQIQAPYFPVDLDRMGAGKEFVRLGDDPLRYGRVTVHSFPLNHPPQTAGYRIESQGAAIVYATDLEHGDPEFDSVLRDYSRNADILIYDSQYTPESYSEHKGWGHSTWLEATRLAEEAGVKQLILFHHDPSHDDETLGGIVAEARRHFAKTDGAREGDSYIL